MYVPRSLHFTITLRGHSHDAGSPRRRVRSGIISSMGQWAITYQAVIVHSRAEVRRSFIITTNFIYSITKVSFRGANIIAATFKD